MPSASSHYHQLQPEDRVTIASLRQQNHSVRAIEQVDALQYLADLAG